jgi:hypothetical protein
MKWLKILKALKKNERSLKKRAEQVEKICNDMDLLTLKLLSR